MNRSILLSSSLLLVAACSSSAPSAPETTSAETASALDTAAHRTRDADRVFVLGNEADNAVLVFEAQEHGALALSRRVSTGGRGSDDGLGSQGALARSVDGRWLLAVNAGSDEVSLFRTTHGGLHLVDVAKSGGNRPISVAESHGLVYVLNAGAEQNVSGFWIDADAGMLRPIAHSARGLSAATSVGPAEVAFSPDGDAVVVTEKGTNSLDTFVVRRDGSLTGARTVPSVGDTPFGFAFDARGTLIVSDAFGGAAGAGALSSYTLDLGAAPSLVTGPVKDGEAAPCWVVVSNDGHTAYTSNTASGSLTGYAIAPSGAIALLPAGATTKTGDGTKPADMALDDDGRLYVLEGGTATLAAFRAATDGSLTAAGSVGGLPAHAVGLATSAR